MSKLSSAMFTSIILLADTTDRIKKIRIFVVFDMKSSTTIAEKIGHENFFHLIKSFYSEMTNAILETLEEIGTLIKEIIYPGDVLNTAVRIQALCNHYNAWVPIFDLLNEHLQIDGEYSFSEIGEISPKGKSRLSKLLRLMHKRQTPLS